MIPVRRDLSFKLNPGSISNWHAQGPQVTHFINAMSIFFPVGERFFIHSVRHFRNHITEPELQKAVTAFIGQEAMHGREHEDYNRLLAQAGFPAEKMERRVDALLNFVKTRVPRAGQLSVTIALEHFTAIMADLLLRKPEMIAGADPHLTALWRWHALEETEHKAVAFDVYEKVMGRNLRAYLLRTGGLVVATIVFVAMLFAYQRQLAAADPRKPRWRGMGQLLNFLFGSPGMLRQLARPWLDYFRPGFHPWDHDNRHLLAELDELTGHVQEFAPLAASGNSAQG